jgi:Response regulator containing a CheY-like receiver domain and an HTH DNA-binding domain
MKDITVLIADDHAILRKGLRLLLEFEEGIAVVGEAADGRGAVRLARKLKPDVVIMDIAMPLLGGIEATREIRRELPATHVLVVSATPDEHQVREALKAGASAYVAKHTSLPNVPTAVREVAAGNTFVGVLGKDARLDLRRQRISQALAQLGFAGAVREESEEGMREGGMRGSERTG